MTQTIADPSSAKPKRVVILGGGPAGVAAAYWLSAPEQKGRYQVALYTQGWRLGGKCASGRNAQLADRIEEHGLHVLMGCYHNAFATLRSCYTEWREHRPDPDNPLQSWTDGFLPQHQVSFMDNDPKYGWQPWNFQFPKLPGEPGDGPLVNGADHAPLPNDEKMILEMADRTERALPLEVPFRNAVTFAFQSLRSAFLKSKFHPNVALAALEHAAEKVETYIGHADTASAAQQVHGGPGETLRRLAIITDLTLRISIGFVCDLLGRGEEGYDELNAMDFRAWLSKHGAHETTVHSALVNAIYDLAFAAVDGADDSDGSLAAGVSFRAQMEIAMGYRNAPLFRMAAGTADTVFTPLYDVLMDRGVDIHFFSRVSALNTSGGQLSEITIDNQADTIGGAPYRPLRRITLADGKSLDSWSNEPLWDQLKDGAQLKQDGIDFEYSGCKITAGLPTILKAEQDFDIVISALPPLSLQPVAQDLVNGIPAWQTAIEQSRSVATQAMQLWMQEDLSELGWSHGSTVLTSYKVPYDSWGDMGEILPFENWSNSSVWQGKVPQSLGYFCGCLEVVGGPISRKELKDDVVKIADDWRRSSLGGLWPKVRELGVQESTVSTYIRANFDLAEQYLQTPAGKNVSARLDPAQPAGLSNLYAIGDWTRTRFSGGCFESAIESGMLAARGISGFPQDIKTR